MTANPKMTDEQLRMIEQQTEDVADDFGFKYAGDERDAATAIIERALQKAFQAGQDALRAERAKPTQSDEERARNVALLAIFGSTEETCSDHDSWLVNVEQIAEPVRVLIASIRAEGSAERAKLEAALREALRRVRKNIPEGAATAFEIINAALEMSGGVT